MIVGDMEKRVAGPMIHVENSHILLKTIVIFIMVKYYEYSYLKCDFMMLWYETISIISFVIVHRKVFTSYGIPQVEEMKERKLGCITYFIFIVRSNILF